MLLSAQDFIPQELQDTLHKTCGFGAQVVTWQCQVNVWTHLKGLFPALKSCVGDGD